MILWTLFQQSKIWWKKHSIDRRGNMLIYFTIHTHTHTQYLIKQHFHSFEIIVLSIFFIFGLIFIIWYNSGEKFWKTWIILRSLTRIIYCCNDLEYCKRRHISDDMIIERVEFNYIIIIYILFAEYNYYIHVCSIDIVGKNLAHTFLS